MNNNETRANHGETHQAAASKIPSTTQKPTSDTSSDSRLKITIGLFDQICCQTPFGHAVNASMSARASSRCSKTLGSRLLLPRAVIAQCERDLI